MYVCRCVCIARRGECLRRRKVGKCLRLGHSGHAGGMFVGPGEIRRGPGEIRGGSLSLTLPGAVQHRSSSLWCHTGLVTLGQLPRQESQLEEGTVRESSPFLMDQVLEES